MRHILPWLLVLVSPVAFAHGDHQGHGELLDGLLHPLLGLDHLLVALAIGLWVGRLASDTRPLRSPYLLVLALTLTMLLAAWLGNNIQLSDGLSALIEPGIAVSLLALGLLLARPAAMPPLIVLALLPALVVAHGLAHGTEGSAAASMAYLAGLGIVTLGLHTLDLWLAPRMTPLLNSGLSLLMLGSGAWALL